MLAAEFLQRTERDACAAGLPSPAPQLGRPERRDRLLHPAISDQRRRRRWGGRPALNRPTTCWCCSARSPRRRRPSRRPRSGTSAGTSPTCARTSRPTKVGPTSSCCRSTPATTAAPCSSAATPGRAPAAFSASRKAQIAEAKANGVKPKGGGGFAYMRGARRRHRGVSRRSAAGALQPRPHVPGAAVLRAALVPATPQRKARRRPDAGSAENRGRLRRSSAGPTGAGPRSTATAPIALRRRPSLFGDVMLTWYMRQGDAPLARHARATVRPHRAQRCRPRRLDRQAAWRGREISRASPTRLATPAP